MYAAIVFAPLIGCLVAACFGRLLGARVSEYITSGLVIFAAFLSWIAFFTSGLGDAPGRQYSLLPWFVSGDLRVDWSLRIDTLTVVMFVVVNTSSALVHVYSIGYMHQDAGRIRFFAYLSLFTWAMLMLVSANNLVQMFFGWEGVGLASYLLIGFWYQRPSANAAAMKAFIVNRVGDLGLLLGVIGLFYLAGSVDFTTIFASLPGIAEMQEPAFAFLGLSLNGEAALTVVALLLFMGAMGKSAHFLLHTWLPDAMEGPTPVSALIHAATMVTAGVFLVARMSPLFEMSQAALTTVTWFGATTAFFAATVGLVQNDIKRVIAYSTCSQLGYMFVALGVGAYPVAIFHLFTHAFFKALLFLGAGSVIHAMSDEQDMRRMGGLRTHIPITFWMMIIGTLALTGFPFTSGFYSKDAVIEAAFVGDNMFASYGFWLTLLAAALTAFYSWRLIFMTFYGRPRASVDVMNHVHESPPVMTVPLVILAFGALIAGIASYGLFIGDHYAAFWKDALAQGEGNHVMHDLHEVPLLVKMAPLAMMILGFVTAWYFYIRSPETPHRLATRHDGLYTFLLNKWYFDEIYNFLFVRPAFALGRAFWKIGDGRIIDRLGPDGVSARVRALGAWASRLQSGYLYHYAFAMLIGVTVMITWAMVGGAEGTQP